MYKANIAPKLKKLTAKKRKNGSFKKRNRAA